MPLKIWSDFSSIQYIKKAKKIAKRIIIQKAKHIAKKKDSFQTLYIMRFIMNSLKLAEVGGHFYVQKRMHCALLFYKQKIMDLVLRFI